MSEILPLIMPNEALYLAKEYGRNNLDRYKAD